MILTRIHPSTAKYGCTCPIYCTDAITKSKQMTNVSSFISSVKRESDTKRASVDSHIITNKRQTESNGLGAKKKRCHEVSEGKVDGSTLNHLKPVTGYSKNRKNRQAHLTNMIPSSNTPDDFYPKGKSTKNAKKQIADTSNEPRFKNSKNKRDDDVLSSPSDDDVLSGFSDFEDNVAATFEKIKKAREKQDAAIVTQSVPDRPTTIEPEEESEEDWEAIKERLRMAPTRNEMIAQQKEREDDGKNDIEFLPVDYDDAFTLDVRERKVRRQVNQHAESQGWPFLTREVITEKIETSFQEIYDGHILPLLKEGGGKDNVFYKDITDYFSSPAAQGASNSALLMYLGRRKYTTGYYTELFSHQLNKHMTDSGIAQDFEDHVKDNQFLNELIIRSGLLFHFQTAICIPETVIRLIMDDRKISYEEADQIRLRSAEFGIVVAEKIKDDERVDSSDSEREESDDDSESASENESEDESGISGSEDD